MRGNPILCAQVNKLGDAAAAALLEPLAAAIVKGDIDPFEASQVSNFWAELEQRLQGACTIKAQVATRAAQERAAKAAERGDK